MKDVSQYLEYTFLKKYLKDIKQSFIVDVGAKGLTCSNSYNFIKDDNWKGLLIEPENKNFIALQKLYRGINRVKLLNIAIGDSAGYMPFYITLARGHHSLIRKKSYIKMEYVRVYQLPFILRLHKVPRNFDILDIDCEGMDFRIIKYMLEKSFFRPTIIILEKQSVRNNKSLLIKFNYKLIHSTKGNFIYEKRKLE